MLVCMPVCRKVYLDIFFLLCKIHERNVKIGVDGKQKSKQQQQQTCVYMSFM